MTIATLFDSASSIMTVISCSTFVGILGWAFWVHRESDFAEAAALPFADNDDVDIDAGAGAGANREPRHG